MKPPITLHALASFLVLLSDRSTNTLSKVVTIPVFAPSGKYHLQDSLYTISKPERDFLLSAGSGLQFSDGYSRVRKSQLQKKIQRFASEELPLLIDIGFI